MALRPDPLRQVLELQERMNRLFDETLSRERMDEPHVPHASWIPLADVFETSDAYVIELELPGLGRSDVHVQAQGSELIVRGERQPSPAGRPETFHRLERRHGSFTRGFRFPDEVDSERIAAELVDGVLRLSVPKTRSNRTTRIRVDPGE